MISRNRSIHKTRKKSSRNSLIFFQVFKTNHYSKKTDIGQTFSLQSFFSRTTFFLQVEKISELIKFAIDNKIKNFYSSSKKNFIIGILQATGLGFGSDNRTIHKNEVFLKKFLRNSMMRTLNLSDAIVAVVWIYGAKE